MLFNDQNITVPTSSTTKDRLSVRDFVSVFEKLTGFALTVKTRRDKLIEYRFKYDNDTKEWIGSKESVYAQLLRNYNFNKEQYPDFDALLAYRRKTGGRIDPFAVPGMKKNPKTAESLLYTNNPYAKKTPSPTLTETSPMASHAEADTANAAIKTTLDEAETSLNKENSNPKNTSRPSKRSKRIYTKEEDRLILSQEIPDEEIAEKIGATMNQIKCHRYDLLHPRRKTPADKSHTRPNRVGVKCHSYSFEENRLILERELPDDKLADKLGLTLHKIKNQRYALSCKGINTVEDLIKRYGQTKPDEQAKERHTVVKEADTQADVTKEPKAEESRTSRKISSLVDRTMDLMSDFEALAKEIDGKEAQLRTKARYELLLKTLINKDLQFFALTAGAEKVAVQDRYLKSIGFTDKEIAHFRGV